MPTATFPLSESVVRVIGKRGDALVYDHATLTKTEVDITTFKSHFKTHGFSVDLADGAFYEISWIDAGVVKRRYARAESGELCDVQSSEITGLLPEVK